MKYSYYPGCTLKNKAKDLDTYARASAKALGFELEEIEDWEAMKLPQSFLLSVHWSRPGKKARIW